MIDTNFFLCYNNGTIKEEIMKVLKSVTVEDSVGQKEIIEEIIHICPVCGKEMDETYMGRDYCEDCAAKLRGEIK